MNILITGGAGYIGSTAAAEVLRAGHHVVVVDDLSQGHRGAVPAEAEFIQADLRDREGLQRALAHLAHIDGIMHFASYTLVGESMQKPLKYLVDNTIAAGNILEIAVDKGIERCILSSTANLFDQPAQMPIVPDERIIPGSPYGESKYFIERMLHWFHRIYGLRYACLRYFNAAGGAPERGEDHNPEMHLIPIVLQVALGQRQKMTLFGGDYPTRDGTCVRDYVHVADLAQAHILAMEALDQLNVRHYNLGTGNGFTNLEVIQTAERVTGRPIPYEIGPRRAGDPAVLVASSDLIRQELGWKPRYDTLESIIASAWEWHSSHPHGYQDRG